MDFFNLTLVLSFKKYKFSHLSVHLQECKQLKMKKSFFKCVLDFYLALISPIQPYNSKISPPQCAVIIQVTIRKLAQPSVQSLYRLLFANQPIPYIVCSHNIGYYSQISPPYIVCSHNIGYYSQISPPYIVCTHNIGYESQNSPPNIVCTEQSYYS